MSRYGSAGVVVRGLIFLIELYRTWVSPSRPASCRFSPTCSRYAVDALQEYGLVRGSWLSVLRLLKCGPWHKGGWDPIPERRGLDRQPRTDSGDVVNGAELRSDSFV